MAKKLLIFIVLYFLYVPGVFWGLNTLLEITHYSGPIPFPSWLGLLLLAVIIGAPAVIFSLTYGQPSRRERWLLKNGVIASAVLLSAEDTGVTVNYFNVGVRVTVKVIPKNETPFEVTTETFFQRITPPIVGTSYYVKYDPNDKRNIVFMNKEAVRQAGLK